MVKNVSKTGNTALPNRGNHFWGPFKGKKVYFKGGKIGFDLSWPWLRSQNIAFGSSYL